MTSQLPSAPASIGAVLDGAVRLYKATFRRCWVLGLIAAVSGFAFGWIESMFLPVETGLAVSPEEALARLMRLVQALLNPIVAGAGLLAFLVSTVCYGAMVVTQKAHIEGEASISVAGALTASLVRLPAVLLASILSTLAIALGWCLLLVPGVWLFVKFSLWTPALFMERAGVFQGLAVSWRLTRQRWWRGFVILSVGLIVIYLFAGIFSAVLVLPLSFVPMSVAGREGLAAAIAEIPSIVLPSAVVAVILAMYNDFRLRSQGGDLAAQVSALRQA